MWTHTYARSNVDMYIKYLPIHYCEYVCTNARVHICISFLCNKVFTTCQLTRTYIYSWMCTRIYMLVWIQTQNYIYYVHLTYPLFSVQWAVFQAPWILVCPQFFFYCLVSVVQCEIFYIHALCKMWVMTLVLLVIVASCFYDIGI